VSLKAGTIASIGVLIQLLRSFLFILCELWYHCIRSQFAFEDKKESNGECGNTSSILMYSCTKKARNVQIIGRVAFI
jgi:hypothetical protein